MESLCTWTPQLLVELTKAAAWPIVVLLISLRFGTGIANAARNFFSKNAVSELTAGATGVSAKFVALRQSSEASESGGTNSISLPANMTAEAIRARHALFETEFSKEIFQSVRNHVQSLGLQSAETAELLMTEISLLQSGIRYLDINKVLFRSQFNMFSIMERNNGRISKQDVERHFDAISKVVGDGLKEWDWIKYVAYPVSHGLLTDENESYSLSVLGRSYVSFMNKNPQMVDELSKL